MPFIGGVFAWRLSKAAGEDRSVYTVLRLGVLRFGSNAVRRPMSGR
jgi:hypothetical protein